QDRKGCEILLLEDWNTLRTRITMRVLSCDNMDKKSSHMTRRQFGASSASALALGPFLRTEYSAAGSVADQPLHQVRPPFRVIIDTDPGVDDAFALLLAMRSPELKIEGITAVAGNVPLEVGLPNALRMVEIASRADIPVAAGAKSPLLRRLEHHTGGRIQHLRGPRGCPCRVSFGDAHHHGRAGCYAEDCANSRTLEGTRSRAERGEPGRRGHCSESHRATSAGRVSIWA